MLGEFDETQLTKLREMFTTQHANADLLNFITSHQGFPDTQQEQIIRSAARERVNRQKDITVPSGFYDDVKYKVDVIITNEQIDVAARLSTLQTALQLLRSNPGIITTPTTKRVFFSLLDLSGISPIDLGIDDIQTPTLSDTLAQFPQRGGSLARPTASLLPVQNTKMTVA